MIKSINYKSRVCILIDVITRRAIERGAVRIDFKGNPCVVEGGAAPHTPGSTGRVQTNRGEFYPVVIGAAWEEPAALGASTTTTTTIEACCRLADTALLLLQIADMPSAAETEATRSV